MSDKDLSPGDMLRRRDAIMRITNRFLENELGLQLNAGHFMLACNDREKLPEAHRDDFTKLYPPKGEQ